MSTLALFIISGLVAIVALLVFLRWGEELPEQVEWIPFAIFIVAIVLAVTNFFKLLWPRPFDRRTLEMVIYGFFLGALAIGAVCYRIAEKRKEGVSSIFFAIGSYVLFACLLAVAGILMHG